MPLTLKTKLEALSDAHRALYSALLPRLEYEQPLPEAVEVTHADDEGIVVAWAVTADPARPNQRSHPIRVRVTPKLMKALQDADDAERDRIQRNMSVVMQGRMMAYPPQALAFAFVIELDEDVTEIR